MDKDFDVFYERELHEEVLKLEQERKACMAKFIKFALFSSIFAIPFVLSLIFFQVPLVIFFFGFLIMGFLGMGMEKIKVTRKKLKPVFKRKILLPILNYLYDDLHFRPRQRMSKTLLNDSLLMRKTVHRTAGDDYVKCKIGETMIHFSEVEAYHGRNIGMFFAGIFISVGFNKKFKTKTVVLPEKITSRFRKFRYNFYNEMQNASIIKLEDPVFEKEFMVIGEDQVEARYILSTSLMQRILDYKLKINKKVSFSFVNNRLYVAIPIFKYMFEPRIYKTMDDKEFIKYNYDYFKLLMDIVEDLDMNTRIWI